MNVKKDSFLLMEIVGLRWKETQMLNK